MAGIYKTPGVYIEEIPKFPPSIAPVETAIPAFIGYTEKAERKGESLKNKPTRIESIAEYEELFGGEPSQQVTLYLDANNQFVRANATTTLFTYNSLRLFYANGGGNCYIVSVGLYDDVKNNTSFDELKKGLDALREADEPTIIVAPDALYSDGGGAYEFQKQALIQCNDLQDRVTLCDLEKAIDKDEFRLTAVENFKKGIGMSYLKYGAAYGPWIKASFQHTLSSRHLTLQGLGGDPIQLETLTSNKEVKSLITALNETVKLVNDISGEKKILLQVDGKNVKEIQELTEKLKVLLDRYHSAAPADQNVGLTNIVNYINDIITAIRVYSYNPVKQSTNLNKLAVDIEAYIKTSSNFEIMKNQLGLKQVFEAMEKFASDMETVKKGLIAPYQDIKAKRDKSLEANKLEDADNTNEKVAAKLQPISKYMIDIVKAIKQLCDAIDPTSLIKLKKIIDDDKKDVPNGSWAKTKTALTVLFQHHNYLKELEDKKLKLLDEDNLDLDTVAVFLGTTKAKLLALKLEKVDEDIYEALNTTKKKGDKALEIITVGVNQAIAFFDFIDKDENKEADLSTLLNPDPALNPASFDDNFKTIKSCADETISFFNFVESAQKNYEKQFNDALLEAFGTYKNLVSKASEALNTLPPSGAIAGVYAAVDRERGVWKAPANVSLNAIKEPVFKISHEQQGEYNVDANTGKSINIIRSFTGKGVLVWGARTLAGNDNEWRYISVRRFFNFVEESVKKATEQFVFEPNDANTWVKIQAMIENFLTTLWRQGALQGIKPEHAFYVAVGLGKTMTALDILEGRMNVEIGMAVVRPAEFIILKFSHKMPES